MKSNPRGPRPIRLGLVIGVLVVVPVLIGVEAAGLRGWPRSAVLITGTVVGTIAVLAVASRRARSRRDPTEDPDVFS